MALFMDQGWTNQELFIFVDVAYFQAILQFVNNSIIKIAKKKVPILPFLPFFKQYG
jgi:hypothetical protein